MFTVAQHIDSILFARIAAHPNTRPLIELVGALPKDSRKLSTRELCAPVAVATQVPVRFAVNDDPQKRGSPRAPLGTARRVCHGAVWPRRKRREIHAPNLADRAMA